MSNTNHNHSQYQEGIFSWIDTGTGHGVVDAKAGSGKTYTLVAVARRLVGKGSALFLAFNKHISEELSTRLDGTNASARTIHSVGFQALGTLIKGAQLEKRKNEKYTLIAEQWMSHNASKFAPEERDEAVASLVKLATFARLTLTDPRNAAALDDMCLHFDIEVNYPHILFRALPSILEEGKAIAKNQKLIDYTDMIWLPIAFNLSLVKYNFILVDEAQDLNACQLELVMKMCSAKTRVLFVGDPSQSIMGFAGADNRSIEKIIERTKATVLPLSICYRCPTSHLDLARMIVPTIEARPNAPAGEVLFAKGQDDLQKMVQAGDLVICRLTAPLVKECIKLIKQRISAKVRGRDIGKDLVTLLKKVAKMEGFEYGKVVAFLEEYRERQVEFLRQKKADESLIESLDDRIGCLQVCAENFLEAKTIDQLGREIESLFDDSRPAVWLSTVHRAKGLENDRVFILRPDKLPLRWKDQQAWQYKQEMNLLYVALTRAKQTLIFLGDLPDPCQKEEAIQPELEALEVAAELEAEEIAALALEQVEAMEPAGEGFAILDDPVAPGWDTCYQCGSVLQTRQERSFGACDGCMGVGLEYTLPAAPATTQQPTAGPALALVSLVELDSAIAALNVLVHDPLAMYKGNLIREAAEEVARLWAVAKVAEEEVKQQEISIVVADSVKCPGCGTVSELRMAQSTADQWDSRTALICPACGTGFEVEPPVPSTTVQREVCPVCGETLTTFGACPYHGPAARAYELDAWGRNEWDNSTDPLTERPLPPVIYPTIQEEP